MAEAPEMDIERGGVELPLALNRHFLVHNTQSILPLRDFYHEVRAMRDVDSLFLSIVVQLDVRLTQLDEILKRMINQIELPAGESISYAEVCNALIGFTDCGNMQVPCIRQRVQSIGVGTEDVAPDQCWLALHCQLDTVFRRQICIARLSSPVNFGPELGDVQFVLLVLGSNHEKDSKSSLETAKTTGTLFSDPAVRNELMVARSPAEVREQLRNAAHAQRDQLKSEIEKHSLLNEDEDKGLWYPGRGILQDFRRRFQHYKSDYVDGVDSARSVQKTISSAVFLFFSIIPTAGLSYSSKKPQIEKH